MIKIDSPFSVSAMGNRLGLGKAGLYRRDDRVTLFLNPSAHFGTGTVVVTNAYVRVPSVRVRMGLIVSTHQLANTESPGTLSYVQIFPGLLSKGSRLDPNLFGGNQDNDDPYYGQGVLGSPSIIQPQKQGAGYFTGPRPTINIASTVATLGTTGVGSWPVFFESQSIAQIYRVEVGIGGAGGELIPPTPVDLSVSWEIIDPRSEADSEALIAGCVIDPVTPVSL